MARHILQTLRPAIIVATSTVVVLIAFLALLMLFAPPALAQDRFPPLSGRVVDSANILTPQTEAALTSRLAALEQQSRHQLVVATIADLQGNDIADYGYQLGRAWGIGGREANDGVLLIIAPNDRKVRIEVGYGLEATLTDALASQIIRDQITPKFREGDFNGGVTAGVEAIARQIELPPDQARAAAAAAQSAQSAQSDDGALGGAIIVVFFFVVIFIIFASQRRSGRRYGSGPIIVWGGGSDHSSWGSSGGGFSSSDFGGGGFSGGGGSFGGGGSSGSW